MRQVVFIGLVLGIAAIPAPALAYVRTFVQPDGGGACLYWGPRTVHYLINEQGVATMPMDQLTSALEAGFNAWVGWNCSDFEYVDDGTTASVQVGYDRVLVSQPDLEDDIANEHLVVFRSQACSAIVQTGDDCLDPANDDCDNKYGCWDDSVNLTGDALAYTLVTSQISTGRIVDADTAFDASDFQFRNLATDICDASVDIDHCADVQNTMAHEAGHFLGMGHSHDVDATMYYSNTVPLETSKRDLDDDDVAGLCAIYPTGQLPSTCVPTRAAEVYAEGCGCGPSPSGNSTVLLLALVSLGLQIASRRRVH